MTTIDQDWQDWKENVYPGVNENTEQMRQLKACWFSAYYGCLIATRSIVAESKNEDHGVELLQSLYDEAMSFISKYVKDESTKHRSGLTMISAKRVEEILVDCLYKKAELASAGGNPPQDAVIVAGIVRNFGFNPVKLEANKKEILALIDELNPTFLEGTGGGWTFLNLPFDKNDQHWGEHPDCENLLCLAIAIKHARIQFPRDMWDAFPGGVPYVSFSKTQMEYP